jgi:hypothetical protein
VSSVADHHVTIPDALRAEIAADLEAGGDRARRWQPQTTGPLLLLASDGVDLVPGERVEMQFDHGPACLFTEGASVGVAVPGFWLRHAWAPIGGVDDGPLPDLDDRVVVLANLTTIDRTGRMGTVEYVEIDERRVGVGLSDGDYILGTRWAILPPEIPAEVHALRSDLDKALDISTGLAEIIGQPATSPTRPWRLGQAWSAHDGPMVTIAETGTGPADQRGRRPDDRLIGAMLRVDAQRVVDAVNHTRGDAESLRALRAAVTASASVGDPHARNARLSSALREIINTLGPDGVCTCTEHDDCGLRAEAAEALRIAREALEATGA